MITLLRKMFWGMALMGFSLALTSCQSSSQTAPESSFLQLDGSRISSQALRGQVWLLNFWATSCTTCVAEMPELANTYRKYHAQGYDTVALAMQYDPPSYVLNFAQSQALPFRVALDAEGHNTANWGHIKVTPTSFLIAKDGRIAKRFVGPPDWPQFHAEIEKLLQE